MDQPGVNASREAGLARLQDFLPRAGARYGSERNIDCGRERHENVSGLSPYLRHRLISEQEVVAAVLQQHSLAASEKFVQEVCWRSYWKGWLQQRPAAWTHYCQRRDALYAQVERDCAGLSSYQQALQGQTGIDCFDAWVRELRETGYLHNHARMWFASIWIFTLRLPWQLGADFFLQHLLDGDAASNTLSWRWVGGLHTAGKHYLARAENIARYTEGRFNPVGQLQESAEPLPLEPAFAIQPLASLQAANDGRRSALLLSDEDSHPESLWPSTRQPPLGIVVWRAGIEQRSPAGLGPSAQAFSDGAIDDALNRARQHWPDVPVQQGPAGLSEWLQEHRIEQLLLAEPCVGATADSLKDPLQSLSDAGITVVRIRRDWDAAFWPQATRGYFQLRQKIPALTTSLLAVR